MLSATPSRRDPSDPGPWSSTSHSKIANQAASVDSTNAGTTARRLVSAVETSRPDQF